MIKPHFYIWLMDYKKTEMNVGKIFSPAVLDRRLPPLGLWLDPAPPGIWPAASVASDAGCTAMPTASPIAGVGNSFTPYCTTGFTQVSQPGSVPGRARVAPASCGGCFGERVSMDSRRICFPYLVALLPAPRTTPQPYPSRRQGPGGHDQLRPQWLAAGGFFFPRIGSTGNTRAVASMYVGFIIAMTGCPV